MKRGIKMDFSSMFQGSIIGFREGLEAFLIIAIMLEYLNKTKQTDLKKNVKQGLGLGLIISVIFGITIFSVSSLIGQSSGTIAKLWESGTSLLAVILITTFIIWMIKHGHHMVSDVENSVESNLSRKGLLSIAAVMVAREGAEVVLFMMVSRDKSSYIIGILLGLVVATILTLLIYKSLVKVNLTVVFSITLAYLILQAGFLLGYAVHEGLSYLKSMDILSETSGLFNKVYNFGDTVLDHKTGAVGIPLYVTLGWYSRPEWLQFALQYLYTFGLFGFWVRHGKK